MVFLNVTLLYHVCHYYIINIIIESLDNFDLDKHIDNSEKHS